MGLPDENTNRERDDFSNGLTSDPEWLKLFYEEAWRQYSHEDNVFQGRFDLYLNVHTSLIGFITIVGGIIGLAVSRDSVSDRDVWVGFAVFAVVSLIVGTLGYRLIRPWVATTNAGRAFISLRWSTARAIEQHASLIGLAAIENKWYHDSFGIAEKDKTNADRWLVLFPNHPHLKALTIRPRPSLSGWDASLALVNVIRWFWLVFIVLAVFLLLFSFGKIALIF